MCTKKADIQNIFVVMQVFKKTVISVASSSIVFKPLGSMLNPSHYFKTCNITWLCQAHSISSMFSLMPPTATVTACLRAARMQSRWRTLQSWLLHPFTSTDRAIERSALSRFNHCRFLKRCFNKQSGSDIPLDLFHLENVQDSYISAGNIHDCCRNDILIAFFCW